MNEAIMESPTFSIQSDSGNSDEESQGKPAAGATDEEHSSIGEKRKEEEEEQEEITEPEPPKKKKRERLHIRGSRSSEVQQAHERLEAAAKEKETAEQLLEEAKALLEERTERYAAAKATHEELSEDLSDVLLTEECFWTHQYNELIKHREKYGTTNVLRDPRNKDDYIRKLGNFVGLQRRLYRNNQLEPYKVILLNRLGFDWDPAKSHWEKMFRQLKSFIEEHGHSNLTKDRCGDVTLYSFVRNLRDGRRATLANQRKSESTCSATTDSATANQRESESTSIATTDSATPNKRKSATTDSATPNKRKRVLADLTPEQISRLEEIGFTWDNHESDFRKAYDALVEYKHVYGNCHVPKEYPQNQFLAQYVKLVRKHWKKYDDTDPKSLGKNMLNPDRIKKLSRLGFHFETNDIAWEDKLRQWGQFRDSVIDGSNWYKALQKAVDPILFGWVRQQMKNYIQLRKDGTGPMSPWRLATLEKNKFFVDIKEGGGLTGVELKAADETADGSSKNQPIVI